MKRGLQDRIIVRGRPALTRAAAAVLAVCAAVVVLEILALADII